MQDEPFRFMKFEIWKMAINVGDKLYDIAEEIAQKKKYKFAEQLNGAALSVSNNIAEGAGCDSDKEFSRFLGIARRSIFENVNMLTVFRRRGLIDPDPCKDIVTELEQLSRQITNFQKSLRKS